MRPFKQPFSYARLSELTNNHIKSIQSIIESETEDYIKSVPATDYVEHLTSRFIIDIPVVDWENLCMTNEKINVPAEYFRRGFDVHHGKTYEKDLIVFEIPINGDSTMLKYRPSNILTLSGFNAHKITLSSEAIEFGYINFSNDKEEIERLFNQDKSFFINKYNQLKTEVEGYNNTIGITIEGYFNTRKSKLNHTDAFMESFGIPLKKKDGVSNAFKIPKPQTKSKISVRPVITKVSKNKTPEYYLSDDDYIEILKLINDIGKNFETKYSSFKEMGEEQLRDHILLTIDPNFTLGSATGETFNKNGKTDICLKYDSTNVFIAECKFWKGEKEYLKTIDQLLGYLTWRDSKAAIIMFVPNKEISPISDNIIPYTTKHTNYIKVNDKVNDGWVNFIFHMDGDKNRQLKLAVLLFHIPK